MRKDFLQKKTENNKKYLTRAAKIYDSMTNGTAMPDGEVLQNTVTASEQSEFVEYIFTIMNPIIVRVVKHEGKAAHLTCQVQDILLSRVYEMVLNEFGKFNNYGNDSGEEYSLESFIKSRIKGCMRESVAEDQWIGVNRSRQLRYIWKVRTAIANEKQVDEDMISVDEICARVNEENKNNNRRNISKKLVMELLAFDKGVISTFEMEENGEQIGYAKLGVGSKFDDEIDYDAKRVLDEVFGQFSGLDFYILMKEFGLLGENIRRQGMCDFVTTSTFQTLLAEDTTIRTKSDPIKMAYNKKIKIKKALASLAGRVEMQEIENNIGKYFEKKCSFLKAFHYETDESKTDFCE